MIWKNMQNERQVSFMIVSGGSDAQEAARRVGIAWALTGLLRAVPHHLREGRVYMPRQTLADAGLTDPTRPDAEQSASLATVMAQVARLARSHIAEARKLGVSDNSSAVAVLRLAPLAEGYLRGLEARGYNLDQYNDDRGALGRQMRLMWAGLRNGY